MASHPSRIARLLLLAAAACAPSRPEVQGDAPPKKAKAEVDPHRLCEVMARVDDARARGTLDALREALLADAPKDRAAAFGAMWAIEKDKARWEAFREDLEAHPESVVGPLGECLVYAAWKMPDQAEGPCKAAAERLDGLALVSVARAEMALRRDRFDEAKAHAEQALALDAACVPAHCVLARALEAKGDADGAVASWAKALEAWPECFSCAERKAALVEKTQGVKAAIPHWEAALAIVPDDADVLSRYAASLAGRDDEKALAAYERALSLGRQDFHTHLAASRLAERTGALDKALDYAEKASQLMPDDVDVWRLLARLYEARKEAEGTERAYTELLRLLPNDRTAHLALARASRERGRYVKALTHYEAAAEGSEGEEADEAAKSAREELKALLAELGVGERGFRGTAERVVTLVQREVRRLYEEQRAKKPGLSGRVDVVVTTDKSGAVDDVRIERDTLNDPRVVAALLAHLRRANISGGAKRYSFELEFE